MPGFAPLEPHDFFVGVPDESEDARTDDRLFELRTGAREAPLEFTRMLLQGKDDGKRVHERADFDRTRRMAHEAAVLPHDARAAVCADRMPLLAHEGF